MYSELSDRKKAILKAVIDVHIEHGEPVGSKSLTEGECKFDLSSATIRSEMAELEAMGYLVQPHTSAGRIPTDLGYRFYVDSLMADYSLTSSEVEQLNKALKTKTDELDRIIRDAGKVVSNLTNYPTIAMSPAMRKSSVLRFSLTRVDAKKFLLVSILGKNKAETKFVNCDIPITDEAVKKLENLLNAYVAGNDIKEITLQKIIEMENEMEEYSMLVSPIIRYVCEIVSGNGSGGDVKVNGVDRLLEYPEFSDTVKLKDMLGFIENRDRILDVVRDSDRGDDISVVLGGETPVAALQNSAVVFKKIIVDGQVVGAIGVIGPSRMDYSKVISTIKYLSDCIEGKKTDTGDKGNG